MIDSNEVMEKIDQLERLSSEVLKLKRKSIPRRPIVIEFCGSPKAGKTSCISALSMFLRRNGFRIKVLVERASVCPVNNKYDPLFNVWTACSAIAELCEIVSNAPKDYDVVILDRGLFDALCWFEWQAANYFLDKESLARIAEFLTLKRWRAAIDLVLIFKANSDASIEREYASLLTRKRGSIMREPILNSYLSAMQSAENKYGAKFRNVRHFDTSEMNQNEVSYNVTELVLNTLQSAVAESVGHISLSAFENIQFSGSKAYSENALPLGSCMLFDARPRVEGNDEVVQPIPILVITDPTRQRVLVAKKNKRAAGENSPEYMKTLLYFGGHTRAEDSFDSGKLDVMSVCKSALTRELKEEIGVDFCPEHLEPTLLVWEKDNDRSKKHLAICFLWEVDVDTLQIKMDKNEFAVNQDTGPTFAFVKDLKTAQLESWSQSILTEVFSVYTAQQTLPLD
jgi:predicted NUDIX family phosphoesterase